MCILFYINFQKYLFAWCVVDKVKQDDLENRFNSNI